MRSLSHSHFLCPLGLIYICFCFVSFISCSSSHSQLIICIKIPSTLSKYNTLLHSSNKCLQIWRGEKLEHKKLNITGALMSTVSSLDSWTAGQLDSWPYWPKISWKGTFSGMRHRFLVAKAYVWYAGMRCAPERTSVSQSHSSNFIPNTKTKEKIHALTISSMAWKGINLVKASWNEHIHCDFFQFFLKTHSQFQFSML